MSEPGSISRDELENLALDGRVSKLGDRYILFYPDRTLSIPVDLIERAGDERSLGECIAIAHAQRLTEAECERRYPDAFARWKARRL